MIEQLKPKPSIVTSVGGLGIERRSDNRVYLNREIPIRDFKSLDGEFAHLSHMAGVVPESPDGISTNNIGRAVMRFVTTESVLRDLLAPSNPLSSHVEIAFPLREGEYFVGLARNGSARLSSQSIEEMVKQTTNHVNGHQGRSPFEYVRDAVKEGYSIGTLMPDPPSQEQVFSLWEKTFGWEKDQVKNLANRLELQALTGEDPSVWFCTLEKRDNLDPTKKQIVAVAMAEKITFKRVNGTDLDLVELTEWSVDTSSRRNGYMSATITRLICQILNDYRSRGKEEPELFAECNLVANAHYSGHSAGLTVPERIIFQDGSAQVQAPQLLIQNVAVGDQNQGGSGLRDFVLMRLSHANLNVHYTKDVVKQVLAMGTELSAYEYY